MAGRSGRHCATVDPDRGPASARSASRHQPHRDRSHDRDHHPRRRGRTETRVIPRCRIARRGSGRRSGRRWRSTSSARRGQPRGGRGESFHLFDADAGCGRHDPADLGLGTSCAEMQDAGAARWCSLRRTASVRRRSGNRGAGRRSGGSVAADRGSAAAGAARQRAKPLMDGWMDGWMESMID